MRRWHDETQWVSDEDGLRWYFSERDPGGPSRLECYRRLLAEPDVNRRECIPSFRGPVVVATLQRVADLLEVVQRAWRGQPVIQREIARHRLESAG
jgi:hypothetical protein